MRIERLSDGSLQLYLDNGHAPIVAGDAAHALVRLGMEAQQKRDAKIADDLSRKVDFGFAAYGNVRDDIRAHSISDADITAALEKADG